MAFELRARLIGYPLRISPSEAAEEAFGVDDSGGAMQRSVRRAAARPSSSQRVAAWCHAERERAVEHLAAKEGGHRRVGGPPFSLETDGYRRPRTLWWRFAARRTRCVRNRQ
jgi:hypothetical protein